MSLRVIKDPDKLLSSAFAGWRMAEQNPAYELPPKRALLVNSLTALFVFLDTRLYLSDNMSQYYNPKRSAKYLYSKTHLG